jgi:hypothetical protein
VSTTPTSSKQRRGVRIVSKTKVPLPPQLKRVNLDAAGIDIGAAEHWAAVPPGRNTEGQDVRRFGAFTGELCALADWLKQCGIQTVAMESTGVYWIPLYELLVERGFEVLLVDARQAKNVPGRKDRCARLPVASGAAYLWIVTRCVSPCRSSLHPAKLSAPTIDAGVLCLPPHSAHAKGVGADES